MTTTLVSKRMWALGAALVLTGTGCVPVVRSTRIRPDYDQVDRQKTKRLVVAVSPLPLGNPKVGELWSLLARRYVNQKRQFIAKENKAVPAGGDRSFDPKSQCGEGVEGILSLKPEMTQQGQGFEVSTTGTLIRCTDGEPVWTADAGGSWPSQDERLKELTAQYVSELGQEVAPYVAPSFNLLRPLLDTLPDPVLTEDDKNEKIDLGE